MDDNAHRDAEEQRVTLVVFSGELDKAMASFNIASTAAAMGMEVTMFFTFWGLNVIRKNRSASKPKDFARRLLGWLNPGGSTNLGLSKLHTLGVGTGMMKKIMQKERMPSLEQLISITSGQGVRFVACTTSIAMMGLAEEDFIPEVKDFAGAASYLNEARQSQVNLFI
jgi:peroxiredoxin family protein